eukprot:2959471-Pleurochrysis_carterae.AAC.1
MPTRCCNSARSPPTVFAPNRRTSSAATSAVTGLGAARAYTRRDGGHRLLQGRGRRRRRRQAGLAAAATALPRPDRPGETMERVCLTCACDLAAA